MENLFYKTKKSADRTVRCYLTTDCNLMCYFCSADVPNKANCMKEVFIPAEVWAEGLNRRKRHFLLAGGEPLIYKEFPKLIKSLDIGYKKEIYSNLHSDIKPFLDNAKERYIWLVSLHPGEKNIKEWIEKVKLLRQEGHSVRIHVVRTKESKEIFEALKECDLLKSTSGQGDQRFRRRNSGKDSNEKYKDVRCLTRIILFGPDGFRYMCLHDLIRGINPLENISEDDDYDWMINENCHNYGLCAPCDDNIEGEVTTNDE